MGGYVGKEEISWKILTQYKILSSVCNLVECQEPPNSGAES